MGTIPYYGATGQVGWIDDYLFDEELILLGEDGAPFLDPFRPKAYVVRGKSWVNNHAHVLRAVGTPSMFWKYQLDAVDYHPYVSGTTRLKLPQAPMRRLKLAVPPLPEQYRIAEAIDSYVSRLDDAVASLERVQAKLKAYRASVLKAAVEGRLVPTEAELAHSENRDYEHADVFVKRILAERRRRWERTELEKLSAAGRAPTDDHWKAKYGEPPSPESAALQLPEGWCWATVGQLGETVTGMTPDSKDGSLYGGVIPFFKPTDLNAGENVIEARQRLSDAGLRRARLIPPGTVLVTCIGATIGKVGLARVSGATNQQINAWIPAEPLRSSRYGYWYFAGPVGRTEVIERSSSTTLPILNKTRFEGVLVPLPPASEQERIVSEVERLVSTADRGLITVSKQLRRMARLRQSILSCGFEGKLVNQDPTDEPVEKLLDRIRSERTTSTPAKKARGRKAKAVR